jgi:hypothetical protein
MPLHPQHRSEVRLVGRDNRDAWRENHALGNITSFPFSQCIASFVSSNVLGEASQGAETRERSAQREQDRNRATTDDDRHGSTSGQRPLVSVPQPRVLRHSTRLSFSHHRLATSSATVKAGDHMPQHRSSVAHLDYQSETLLRCNMVEIAIIRDHYWW